MRVLSVVLLLTPAFTISQASGQEIGNAFAGKTSAVQLCAECHNTRNSNEASPNSTAPPFAMIASTKGMTAMALNVWMQTSHKTTENAARLIAVKSTGCWRA